MNSGNSSLTSLPEKGIIYFIGIGGIGMSAVARYFLARGYEVSGYDKTPTALTSALMAEGIAIHFEEDIEKVPLRPDLIVYTPAIPKEHKELNYYKEQGFRLLKRSDVLQLISQSSFNICIAGTHGKTTVTSMVAHLLRDSGYGCNAFLGGISANYNTNFWSNERNVCVIEADEYDRSFLKLSPNMAIVTAMDADHLDIYGTADAVEQAFVDFSHKIKPGGLLVHKAGLKKLEQTTAKKQAYALQDAAADCSIADWTVVNGGYDFSVVISGKRVDRLRLNMGGLHNLENMLAAITIAVELGIEEEAIRAAVESYKGVKRRFEYKIAPNEATKPVFIDDYAHHPEELRALLTGVRSLFGDKTVTIIFQPHLFSRTKDFAAEFAAVLSMADKVILLPIYPARELPVEGVSSAIIAATIPKEKVVMMEKETLIQSIKALDTDILVTAGAGDIDKLLPAIKEQIIAKN